MKRIENREEIKKWLQGRTIEEIESRGLSIGKYIWVRDEDDDQNSFWNQSGTDFIEVIYKNNIIAILSSREQDCDTAFWEITNLTELPKALYECLS